MEFNLGMWKHFHMPETMTNCNNLKDKTKKLLNSSSSWRLWCVDCVVKEKVGQGQPLTKDIAMQTPIVIVIIILLLAERLY